MTLVDSAARFARHDNTSSQRERVETDYGFAGFAGNFDSQAALLDQPRRDTASPLGAALEDDRFAQLSAQHGDLTRVHHFVFCGQSDHIDHAWRIAAHLFG